MPVLMTERRVAAEDLLRRARELVRDARGTLGAEASYVEKGAMADAIASIDRVIVEWDLAREVAA